MMYQAIAAIVLAAALFGAGWKAQGWRMGEQIAEMQSQAAKDQFTALEKAHAETLRTQAQADEAARRHAARSATLADAAARAGSERDRLRDELAAAASALPGASCQAANDYAAALGSVFGDCANQVEGMARKAGGHAADTLKLLESWPGGGE